MKITDFKDMLRAEARQELDLTDDKLLESRINVALYNVATATEPRALYTVDDSQNLYRQIGQGEYLRHPEKATVAGEEDIDIDDTLLRVVALYVTAMYLPRHSNILMGIYYDEIGNYNFVHAESIYDDITKDTNDEF